MLLPAVDMIPEAGHQAATTAMDWTPIAGLILGGLYQRFLRAPLVVPQWVGYVILGVVAVPLWLFASPAVDTLWKEQPHDLNLWRSLGMSAWMFYFAVRGMAAGSKDAGVTPPADTVVSAAADSKPSKGGP